MGLGASISMWSGDGANQYASAVRVTTLLLEHLKLMIENG